MKARALFAIALAAFLLLVLAVPAFAQTPSPFVPALPDLSSSVNSQVNGFLFWPQINGMVVFLLALAVGTVALSIMLTIWLRR